MSIPAPTPRRQPKLKHGSTQAFWSRRHTASKRGDIRPSQRTCMRHTYHASLASDRVDFSVSAACWRLASDRVEAPSLQHVGTCNHNSWSLGRGGDIYGGEGPSLSLSLTLIVHIFEQNVPRGRQIELKPARIMHTHTHPSYLLPRRQTELKPRHLMRAHIYNMLLRHQTELKQHATHGGLTWFHVNDVLQPQPA